MRCCFTTLQTVHCSVAFRLEIEIHHIYIYIICIYETGVGLFVKSMLMYAFVKLYVSSLPSSLSVLYLKRSTYAYAYAPV